MAQKHGMGHANMAPGKGLPWQRHVLLLAFTSSMPVSHPCPSLRDGVMSSFSLPP